MKTDVIVAVGLWGGIFGAVQFGCSGASSPTQQGQPSGRDLSLQELSVDRPEHLPPCIFARQGQVAYVSSTMSLVACVDRHWVPIVLPSGHRDPKVRLDRRDPKVRQARLDLRVHRDRRDHRVSPDLLAPLGLRVHRVRASC